MVFRPILVKRKGAGDSQLIRTHSLYIHSQYYCTKQQYNIQQWQPYYLLAPNIAVDRDVVVHRLPASLVVATAIMKLLLTLSNGSKRNQYNSTRKYYCPGTKHPTKPLTRKVTLVSLLLLPLTTQIIRTSTASGNITATIIVIIIIIYDNSSNPSENGSRRYRAGLVFPKDQQQQQPKSMAKLLLVVS